MTPVPRGPWTSTAATKPPSATPAQPATSAPSTPASPAAAPPEPSRTPRGNRSAKTAPPEATAANTTPPSLQRCFPSAPRGTGAKGAPLYRTLPMYVISILCYLLLIHIMHHTSSYPLSHLPSPSHLLTPPRPLTHPHLLTPPLPPLTLLPLSP